MGADDDRAILLPPIPPPFFPAGERSRRNVPPLGHHQSNLWELKQNESHQRRIDKYAAQWNGAVF